MFISDDVDSFDALAIQVCDGDVRAIERPETHVDKAVGGAITIVELGDTEETNCCFCCGIDDANVATSWSEDVCVDVASVDVGEKTVKSTETLKFAECFTHRGTIALNLEARDLSMRKN
jgi:hypothetical protein